ncbi:unnamed protein product, partial [Prorocentrum cordatum]
MAEVNGVAFCDRCACHVGESGKVVALKRSAKKQTHNKTSNYTVTMAQSESMLSKDSDQTLGKLRSDFLGLEFVAYGAGMNPKKIETTSSHNAIQLARE